MKNKIGASLACANQINLRREIEILVKSGIDFLHIDIMDGVFVNNYCIGTQIFKYLEEFKDIEIEVHLMVDNPFKKLDIFKDKYCHKLSFHIEACKNPIQTLTKIKSFGKECGIAINAATHERSIYYLYDYLDYILIMAVEAGFAGQDFVQTTIEKTKKIRKELNKRKMSKDIYIDGHVDKDTILKLRKAGANAFIGGSSGLFVSGYPIEHNAKILRNTIK